MSRLLLALGVLAGCAAPPALVEPAAPLPASPEATVSLAPLAQVTPPVLPAALRSSASGEMDHSGMPHSRHAPASGGSGAMAMDAPATGSSEALADALDAYLAIQSSLARDAFGGLADHALAFADAWSFATDDAPEADPHFWHMRTAGVQAVGTHALALAEAMDLDAAREAFGNLSAPFVALIEAHGAPSGYDLSRFSCGMRSDLPEGGVWLQRGTKTQNPYYGAQMFACGTHEAAVPSRASDIGFVSPEASGGTHTAEHETRDHH